MVTGESTTSSSSNNNNNNNNNSSNNNGRERAIEALIDMDPKGASFRVGKLTNEIPKSNLAVRPYRMTNAALMDVAQSLGVYEIHPVASSSDSAEDSHVSVSRVVAEAWKEFWKTPTEEDERDLKAMLLEQDLVSAAVTIWFQGDEKLAVGTLLAPYSYSPEPKNLFQLDASLAHHLLQQQPPSLLQPQPPPPAEEEESSCSSGESSNSNSSSGESSSSSSDPDLVEEEMEMVVEDELEVEMQRVVEEDEVPEQQLQRLSLDDHPYYPDQTDHSMIPSTIAIAHILRILHHQLKQPPQNTTHITPHGIGYALFSSHSTPDTNTQTDLTTQPNVSALILLLDQLANHRKEALQRLLEDDTNNPVALEYETKGMKRKAAAASQYAHLRKEHSIYHHLEYLSTCTYLTISCLLLQFSRKTTPLPTCITSKLTHILENNFMQAQITDYSTVKENHFMSLPLLHLSTQLWAQLLPFQQVTQELTTLIPSCRQPHNPYQTQLLHDILHSTDNNATPTNLVPWEDVTLQYLKCEALCHRFRVHHNLDQLISKPTTKTNTNAQHKSPNFPKPLLQQLFSTLMEPNDYYNLIDSNLYKLYLALSHRIHKNILLWDDLPTITNDGSSCSTSGALLSNGTEDTATSLHLIPNPAGYELDGTKCADSIAIVSSSSDGNLFSANQRASKVWGTVVSQKCFLPKSGVHRWALQMDRCERGHVFVGVASSLVSTKTYVGGDKNGWGVIGTQALWHDRTKLRGDYGGTFRTGSTVVVTLDTDVGTLSFGLWKDKFHQMEDWGIAFEGLPLDVKLYPAIGLYQRDDKVTILGISSYNSNSHFPLDNASTSLGECFYPTKDEDSVIRDYNFQLNQMGIWHAKQILTKAISLLEQRNNTTDQQQHAIFQHSLPSLASCLSLLPSSIPILSGTVAMTLLPLVLKCLNCTKDDEEEDLYNNAMNGKWIIRATSSATSTGTGTSSNGGDVNEEYVVNLKAQENGGFQGDGIGTNGRSTNGHVEIVGTVRGSSLQFVEEWTDHGRSHSSCVIDARIYGTKFEGTYRNVQYGTTGMIAGVRSDSNTSTSNIGRNRYLLNLAALQLIRILSNGAPMEDVLIHHSIKDSAFTQLLMDSPILSSAWTSTDSVSCIKSAIQSIQTRYIHSDNDDDFAYYKDLLDPLLQHNNSEENPINDSDSQCREMWRISEDLDQRMQGLAGGSGSLSPLDRSSYISARKSIISVLLYHAAMPPSSPDEEKLTQVWRRALHIMESGLRNKLANFNGGSRKEGCQEFCQLVQSISSFLFQKCRVSELSFTDVLQELTNIYCKLTEVQRVQEWQSTMTQQGIFKYIGFVAIHDLLQQGFVLNHIVSLEPCPGTLQQVQTHLSTQQHKIRTLLEDRLSDFLQQPQQPIMCAKTQSKLLILTSQYMSSTKHISYQLMENLFRLLQSCKASLSSTMTGKLSQGKEVDLLLEAASHHCNRVLCRSILSIFHVALYHHNHTALITSFLEQEIKDAIDMIHQNCKINVQQTRQSMAKSDYERILDVEQPKTNEKKTTANRPLGVSHILQYGNSMTQTTKGSTATTSSEYVTIHLNCAQDYLTHLLNAISSLLQSNNNNPLTCSFVSLLVNSVEDVLLPVRFKIRLLRLLRFVLPTFPSNPDILQQLLILSDVTTTRITEYPSPDASNVNDTTEIDTFLVAKEATSLLRTIYHQSSDWRALLHSNIPTFFQREELCRGLMVFLGGIPGRIIKGSFVLLKPPMASSLSSNISSSSSSTKSYSSSGGSPPVIVGSGMEGIVTGLCRSHALAGMVSHLDTMNNTCEVILFERKDNPTSTPMATSGKHHTVRAVRAPLSDVVSADETPLVMDGLQPLIHILTNRLHPTLQKMQQIILEEEDDKDLHLWNTLSALRSATLLLSDPDLLESYLQNHINTFSKESLTKLLQLASSSFVGESYPISNAACFDSLSSMPDLEARFWHFQGMLWNTLVRQNALQNEPLDQLIHLDKDNEATGEDDNQSSSIDKEMEQLEDQMEGFATPPASTLSRTSSDTTNTNNNHSASNTNSNVSDGSRQALTATSTATAAATANSTETATEEEDEDEEENDTDEATRLAEETAAAHLREAAIVQMAELGLPRSWSEYALRRVGGTNIEAAVHFCLERGGDMERLLAEERERTSSNGNPMSSRRTSAGANHLIRQLIEMGFPSHWCAEALAETGNNVDEALTWILTNGERLSAVDEGNEEEGAEEDEDDEDDDEDDENHSSINPDISESQNLTDTLNSMATDNSSVSSPSNKEEDDILMTGGATNANNKKSSSPTSDRVSYKEGDNDDEIMQESKSGWDPNIVCPVRTVSGRASIDKRTLEITGLPSGGFSSVGTKGVLLTKGKWYYEAVLLTAGCNQVGWADSSFSGHCQADRGDGCGDGPSSWAYDGWRRYRWHSSATEWGCRWQEGDIVGCMVDMDQKIISFTLNGKAEEIGMGVAFSGSGFRPCSGVYACVSFNRREKIRMILGGEGNESFKYTPPPGYRGVGEAVLEAVLERTSLGLHEKPLESNINVSTNMKNYLCDFSDGEHGHELFAWQHRYYGSDASVHLGSSSRPSSKGSNSRSRRSLKRTNNSISSSFSSATTVTASLQHLSTTSEEPILDSFTMCEKKTKLHDLFNSLALKIRAELSDTTYALIIMYARKLLLHIIMTLGFKTKLDMLFEISNVGDEDKIALQVWNVLEATCSLHTVGWVGEAGAMAIAAEALGLGISTNDQNGLGAGICTINNMLGVSGSTGTSSVNVDMFPSVVLPSGGISQVLSSVQLFADSHKYSASTFAACAEASLGGDGGGILVFLRYGLLSAVSCSLPLRNIFIAAIRRSVRLLSVIEFVNDEGVGNNHSSSSLSHGFRDDDDIIEQSRTHDQKDASKQTSPDPWLISFLTGLLLSDTFSNSSSHYHGSFAADLFEAWSIGLLSASAPWRMVCALTASSILNMYPQSLHVVTSRVHSLCCLYERLESTVVRRVWAERAAVPVCSKYIQAYMELLSSVRRSKQRFGVPMRGIPLHTEPISMDAATPLSFVSVLSKELATTESTILRSTCDDHDSFEWNEGWIMSDSGWEVWTGIVEIMSVHWTTPLRSAVRTLMDGGEGPPMLREGCTVIRGLDWEEDGSGAKEHNEDGKDIYDKLKESYKETEKQDKDEMNNPSEPNAVIETSNSIEIDNDKSSQDTKTHTTATTSKKRRKKKMPNPKLAAGKVISIESWRGIPALGRRVRWDLTGVEGVYRYGGDGGRYDIAHVEVNEKSTRIRKRHPLPESAEQCAARYGFGQSRRHNIILRIRKIPSLFEDELEVIRYGVLEWPDFGATVFVECRFHEDGAVTLVEKQLLSGSKDSGWEARFGEPSYVPGTVMVLSPTNTGIISEGKMDENMFQLSQYEELLGSSSHLVSNLRDRADGGRVRVTSEMRLVRGRSTKATEWVKDFGNGDISSCSSPLPPPIHFDDAFHASSLSLSRDGRTVTCTKPDGRGTAFASVGFTKGVHYWEVKLEQADIGSVFIGVAEKPIGPSSTSTSSFGLEGQPRLNRWLGWGFVNFRATYTTGAERVYGAHCHGGDTVGVLLDCDAGRISFFFDGVKYGEHILNDLGCAFENLSPFGFNADGCGSGGAGQGAPSSVEGGRSGRYPANGAVRPNALWPVVGLRNPGDRVTFSGKWLTSAGVDTISCLSNVLAVDSILCYYEEQYESIGNSSNETKEETTTSVKSERRQLKDSLSDLPEWFLTESYREYERWRKGRWARCSTRGSGPHDLATFGLNIDVDKSPFACACACASLGLKYVLLPGDCVAIKRSAGRLLELQEEAVILGVCQGRLYYKLTSQKSEGGSLTEGGGRAWFWDESEVVDGLELIGQGRSPEIEIPLLERFKCPSKGLRVIFNGGAVVRSDLEIFEGSITVGTVPLGSIIPRKNVLERRMNSCGVVRYRIKYESIEGWISARIRGGKEEAIVEHLSSSTACKTSSEPNAITDLASDVGSGERRFQTPEESAKVWFTKYQQSEDFKSEISTEPWAITDLKEFQSLLSSGIFSGMTTKESDSFLSSTISKIANYSTEGNVLNCSFHDLLVPILFALHSRCPERLSYDMNLNCLTCPGAKQAAAEAFTMIKSSLPELKSILARVAMLRAFNRRALFALPWLPLRPPQEGGSILGGQSGCGTSVDRSGRSRSQNFMKEWPKSSYSIGARIRSNKNLFFNTVKRSLLDSIINATTTPTPLSHDEYELPREVRTVRVNRLKARRTMASSDVCIKRKFSVFSQLQHEMRNWSGAMLRRGYVAKGHGGQKRAFKVKLVGEGVNDYSGPYREVFTDALREVSELDEDGNGALGVLEPCPNQFSGIGKDQSLFVFSSEKSIVDNTWRPDEFSISENERSLRNYFASYIGMASESTREVEDSLIFLGKLVGTACRHGIPVDLPLPLKLIWCRLAEDDLNLQEALAEVDVMASRMFLDDELSFDITISSLLSSQQRMLNAFSEGLSSILPLEIFALFSGNELRDIICGNPFIDVDLLCQVVEYEGYSENDTIIRHFWEVLREMSEKQRKLFLQFVWARSRLPIKESDFEAPFKIQKNTNSKTGDSAASLPSASTCFFSLSLPEYESKALLKEKLLFAINNVTTMESDYVTNDAEVGEGWRGV